MSDQWTRRMNYRRRDCPAIGLRRPMPRSPLSLKWRSMGTDRRSRCRSARSGTPRRAPRNERRVGAGAGPRARRSPPGLGPWECRTRPQAPFRACPAFDPAGRLVRVWRRAATTRDRARWLACSSASLAPR